MNRCAHWGRTLRRHQMHESWWMGWLRFSLSFSRKSASQPAFESTTNIATFAAGSSLCVFFAHFSHLLRMSGDDDDDDDVETVSFKLEPVLFGFEERDVESNPPHQLDVYHVKSQPSKCL